MCDVNPESQLVSRGGCISNLKIMRKSRRRVFSLEKQRKGDSKNDKMNQSIDKS